jgi:hypothetical protein
MLHRSAFAVSTAAWLLSFGAGSALAAEGERAASSCPPGCCCMWKNSYYAGSPVAYCTPGCKNMPPGWNNTPSSYWNRSNKTCRMYYGNNCQRPAAAVPPGGADPAMDPPVNDAVSSAIVL